MRFWAWVRRWFGLPERLFVRYDSGGRGKVVVFLHGIASSGEVWVPYAKEHEGEYRIVVVDLLGFGDSPKPSKLNYTVDDHADAIIYTLRRLGVRRCHLVGHSMGALIALHIATIRPEMVKELICVAMPIYDLGADKRRGLLRYRTNSYVRLYAALIAHTEGTWKATRSLIEKIGPKVGFVLEHASLVAFRRSLENTIVHQKGFEELKNVSVPTTVIYGTLDLFVMQDHYAEATRTNPKVRYERIRATHMLDGPLMKATREAIARAIAD